MNQIPSRTLHYSVNEEREKGGVKMGYCISAISEGCSKLEQLVVEPACRFTLQQESYKGVKEEKKRKGEGKK